MKYYIGLDVSQKSTALCVIEETGKIFAEGNSLSRPQDIVGWISNRVAQADVGKVVLEAGNLSSWLYTGLHKAGLPVVCLEAFHAHRFLATQRNKTDKNDARGLAQLARLGEGFMRVVTVRSQASQETRALLAMRHHLVSQKVSLENHIAGVLKPFGLIVARGGVVEATFRERVVDALKLATDRGLNLETTVMPCLDLYRQACAQLHPLQEQVEKLAAENPVCQRLMSIPGVGSVTALAFTVAVDYPERFKKSADVAAYFWLTPRQFQSGDVNHYHGISKRGDMMVRHYLVNAATVLLSNTKKWCSLKAWGMKLAKKHGFAKARVAVARKLAVMMHVIWMKNQEFRWDKPPATPTAVKPA